MSRLTQQDWHKRSSFDFGSQPICNLTPTRPSHKHQGLDAVLSSSSWETIGNRAFASHLFIMSALSFIVYCLKMQMVRTWRFWCVKGSNGWLSFLPAEGRSQAFVETERVRTHFAHFSMPSSHFHLLTSSCTLKFVLTLPLSSYKQFCYQQCSLAPLVQRQIIQLQSAHWALSPRALHVECIDSRTGRK